MMLQYSLCVHSASEGTALLGSCQSQALGVVLRNGHRVPLRAPGFLAGRI